MADDVEDRGKVLLCATYVGGGIYRPSPDAPFLPIGGGVLTAEDASAIAWEADDGSAAHEPVPDARFDALSAICDILRRENASLRGMLSRVEEAGETVATDDPVKADIERTIDHLQRDKVSPKLRGDLRRATDQAERVNPGANDSVWRARR